MKEFNKWLREPINRKPSSYPRFETGDEDWAAKQGWKAALEWAEEQGSVNNYKEIANELRD